MATTRKSGRDRDHAVGQAGQDDRAGQDVGPDELIDRLKPVVGPEIEATMLTSADELIEWGERILDAESLDDVFAGS